MPVRTKMGLPATPYRYVSLSVPPPRPRIAKREPIKIAVLDSGIDYKLPDLAHHVLSSIDLSRGGTGHWDHNGHGTHVSGIIVRNAPQDVGLYNMKIAEDSGILWASRLVQGIELAVSLKVDIINMSCVTPSGTRELEKAVKEAKSAGVLMIAASGNLNKGNRLYPGCYPEVLGVGATYYDGKIWELTNLAPWVDLLAPGVDVTSLAPREGTAKKSGTSMAAAFISGISAVILSAGYPPGETEKILLDRYGRRDAPSDLLSVL